MKTKLASLTELKTVSDERASKNLYHRVWDEIYFTNIHDKHPNGTINAIQKLYNPDNNSIRLAFTYHIDGCFHTEYLENQPDICDVSELVAMATKLYADKVRHIKFVPQPDWIN